MVEALKVLQDVYQALLLEDAMEESFVISNLIRFYLPVYALPFHISICLSGNGACFGGQHIADNAKGIEDKQAGALLLVLLYLQVGILFLYIVIGG